MTGEPVRIAVWAPRAGAMEIALGETPQTAPMQTEPGQTEPMQAGAGGWWSWEGDPAAYGEHLDYAFIVDGAQPPLPDPRSAWQPHGVHGPSRHFDTTVFEWTDDDWRGTRSGAGVLGGVVYELHIGTFTPEGTLDAAVEHLDHLVELGVDLVQLLPVAAFPGRWGWGYDGVALYAVHDGYGGPAALQRFVDAAHGKGLGVCLDVVYNHLGPSGNYLSRFGPYFTDRHHTPWGEAVNLDGPDSRTVRDFVIGNATRWMRDFHIDALRLDAVHELRDDSDMHLLAELSDAVGRLAAELGRPLELIAESDLNDTVMVTSTALGGLGMTAQWDDDVHHALHTVLTGEIHGYYGDFGGGAQGHEEQDALAVLAKVFTRGFLHDGTFSTFRGGPWGKPVATESFDARRLLGYLQTHDQVGNRALGERITALLPPGRQHIGAALYLLGPFTPMIFAGEEWATSSPWLFFTSFEDADLAEAVRLGRREEFAGHGWAAETIPDPQAVGTRDESVLRWRELHGTGGSMFQWYRDLIALRRKHIDGPTHLADVVIEADETARLVRMQHAGLSVIANLGEEEASFEMAEDPGVELLSSGAVTVEGRQLTLAPDAVVILG